MADDGKVLVHGYQKETGKAHEFRLAPGEPLPDGFVDSPEKCTPHGKSGEPHGKAAEPHGKPAGNPEEEAATAIGEALQKAGHGRGQEKKAEHANPHAKKGAA
jgi:hypothetical protein